ncbi:PTS sugar transporter subunit IIA, partial [Dermatophilus congolensis]
MSRLKELLPIEAVNVNITAPDWRCAISEAGALLNATGTADPAYTDAMIATVDTHGPYIVIAPGFAFAHARPDSSVHHTGMSAIRLTHPVEFGNPDNDPVTLIVALAATDSDAHQQALAELAGLLSDPTRRAAIETATTATELHA